MKVISPKLFMPPVGLLAGTRLIAVTIGAEASGHKPGFAEVMVEDGKTVIKANATVGQLEIVHRVRAQSWLSKVFQIVAPIAKAAAEWKGQVDLVDEFVPRE